jgi:hypothetical protein
VRLNIAHRLRRGHWPEYRFAPISDFLEWRVCGICHPLAPPRAPYVLSGESMNYVTIVRPPPGFELGTSAR